MLRATNSRGKFQRHQWGGRANFGTHLGAESVNEDRHTNKRSRGGNARLS
jgi:hypothetical protein